MKQLLHGILIVCFLAVIGDTFIVAGMGNQTNLSSPTSISKEKTLSVGILFPFSGQCSWVSRNVFPVIQMIAQEVNSGGGICGNKIVLVRGDTKGKEDIGAEVCQKLVEDEDVVAFIGPTSLSFTKVKEIIRNNKVPMISPTAGITELDKAGRTYFYRTVPSDFLGGRVIARAITDPQRFMGLTSSLFRIAVMVGALPAMTSFKEPIQEGMDQFGGSLADMIEYETEKDSYKEDVLRVLKSSPDIIILIGTPDDSVLIMQAAHKSGYKGLWFLTQDQTNDEFIRLAGPELLKGVYGLAETSPTKTAHRVEAFRKRFREYCGEDVKIFDASTYDASNILFLAILRAELRAGQVNCATVAKNIRMVANDGPNKVEVTNFIRGKQMLEAGKEINYQGLNGPMDFDEYGNIITSYEIRRVQKDAWVSVETISVDNLVPFTSCVASNTAVYEYEGTKQLVRFVDAAVEEIEKFGEEAFPKFREKGSNWFHDDSYIFVWGLDGMSYVYPPDVSGEGKNMLDLKDISGKSIGRMLVKRATSPTGEGWVHYQWPKPGGENPVWKSTFIKRATAPSGKTYLVGSGKYNMECERIFIVNMVDRAISLLEKKGLAALDIIRSPSGEFIFLNSYIFIKDDKGNELLNVAFPELEGTNVANIQDSEGKYFVREELEILKTRDDYWMEYMWPKPGETKPSKKLSYGKKVVVDNRTLIVGAGYYP
ncbi:MAG: ABC transporter substrate-binding protein [Planctomycetes bacterium]|nr:ABC transporter substrate-binding protein [Planctomycetota bacterium]